MTSLSYPSQNPLLNYDISCFLSIHFEIFQALFTNRAVATAFTWNSGVRIKFLL